MKLVFSTLIALLIACRLHSAELPYHSQVGQDRFLNERVFHNKRNGIFVDIGAYDGVTISNTLFYETGLNWSGICIEPLPDVFQKLKKNRSCICINACIGQINGMVHFSRIHSPILSGADMLSGMTNTYDPRSDIDEYLLQYSGKVENLVLPSRKLNDVLNEHKIQTIDYLSIDTEGGELLILQSIDFDRYNIHVMTVENNYKDNSIREFLATKGFALIATLEQDEVFENTRWKA